ncbi:SMP-30/gluconolactonase/LRE family protein [Heyndrickxia ginsengihumi]|uniref:SMP-30/gluconolactonase/LRE family protein n=1 Tax=Heyndrickxia ginsengihumi TaxID=363870 RepID=UPI00204084B9|nr:SMP-30/gluconolactonase/LRE family protein [Heyndrickxia ginsengihumi]MCM3024853.1 SMP-30/gluconolactonase/LRE family protein [Heyndrickxia ginsengihumi]
MKEKSIPALVYNEVSEKEVPILAEEKNLQTITAEPWLKISDKGMQLEGLCFDRESNLFLLEVFGGQVFKVTLPKKEITTIVGANNLNLAALKIHKDGRLFLCALGDFESKGGIFSIQPDGSNMEVIIPDSAGYCVDDLVFDSKGGFYFTDFRGHSSNPVGGVYYVSPDFQTITPILQNMAGPNGVALSVDERRLWVAETNANRLHHVELMEDGVTIPPFGASVPYHFTGLLGLDSCCIDSDDNLYVAMYEQGRVLIFNKKGYPIGQILIPGREYGHMLRSTHPAFIPGTDQLIICSNDGDGGEGSWLYTAKGFAKGKMGYQFQQ